MKVKKQDVKVKNHNISGKKVKQLSSGKVIRCMKDTSSDVQASFSKCRQQEEETKISNVKRICVPSETRREYISDTAETGVLSSNEGILRQVRFVKLFNSVKFIVHLF